MAFDAVRSYTIAEREVKVVVQEDASGFTVHINCALQEPARPTANADIWIVSISFNARGLSRGLSLARLSPSRP